MPDMTKGILGSVESAAILLMSLGEKEAADVLRHMEPKEVQKIGTAMASLTNVAKDRVTQVLAGFVDTVQNQTALGIGSEEYIRKMLVGAIGEDKAGGIIDRILHGGNTKGLENLKWMDPRSVAELVRLEHPQIIAIILAYLDSDQSAEVLAQLSEQVRVDVLMRIASLDGIPPSALAELNAVMEKQFAGKGNVKSSSVGGVKTAANILNLMDASVESIMIAKIKEADESLATKLEDLMFVFEDLSEMEDRGIQTLLREVSSEILLLALKGASEGIKEKVFKNMSKRAGEMLRDDLEAKGPVRLSEVEKAQKEVLSIARRMAEAGELSLGSKSGGEQYV
jgi:flagellar motor switch protein FliG